MKARSLPKSGEDRWALTTPANEDEPPARTWRLLGADGRPYASARPGTLGGHRGTRIYGRLDCPAARRAIARGGYVVRRVFFADEATAIAAGYRPCAVCLPERYAAWKHDPAGFALLGDDAEP